MPRRFGNSDHLEFHHVLSGLKDRDEIPFIDPLFASHVFDPIRFAETGLHNVVFRVEAVNALT